MIDALARHLRSDGATLLGVDGATTPIRIVKASGKHGLTNRVNFLVFCGTEAEPRLVCRVPRDAGDPEPMRREWAIRRAIDARLVPTLRETVARPLALLEIQGSPVLVEAGLRGRLLRGPSTDRFELGRRRRVEGELRAVAGWLRAFHDCTTTERRAWAPDDEEERIQRICAEAAKALEAGSLPWLASELRRRLEPLRGFQLRWTAEHGDLWHGNVLRHAGGIGVVDWECAQLAQPSFVDSLMCAFQYLYPAWREGRTHAGATAGAPDRPLWLREAVARFVSAVEPGLAADPDACDAAFLVALAGGYGQQPASRAKGEADGVRALLALLVESHGAASRRRLAPWADDRGEAGAHGGNRC